MPSKYHIYSCRHIRLVSDRSMGRSGHCDSRRAGSVYGFRDLLFSPKCELYNSLDWTSIRLVSVFKGYFLDANILSYIDMVILVLRIYNISCQT